MPRKTFAELLKEDPSLGKMITRVPPDQRIVLAREGWNIMPMIGRPNVPSNDGGLHIASKYAGE